MVSTALSVLTGKNVPAHVQRRRAERKADYSGVIGSGASTNRISLKGNRFALRVAGETIYTHTSQELDVKVVATMPRVGRQWFATGYDEDGEKTGPSCYSQDGQKPDPRSPAMQCASCKMCPKNQKGSGQGGKGKACSYIMNMVVEMPGDDDDRSFLIAAKGGSIFGDQDEADAKFNLKSYLAALQMQDYEHSEVYTRMSFDPDSGVPKLLFTPISVIEDENETQRLREKAKTEEVKAMLRVGGNAPAVEEEVDEGEEDPAPPARQLLPPKAARPAPQAAAEPEEDPEGEVADAPVVQTVNLGGKPKAAAATPRKPRAAAKPAVQEDVEDAQVVDTPAAAPVVQRVNLTGKPKATAAPVQRTVARPAPVAQDGDEDAPAPKPARAAPKPQAAKPAALRSEINVAEIDNGLASLVADWEEAA